MDTIMPTLFSVESQGSGMGEASRVIVACIKIACEAKARDLQCVAFGGCPDQHYSF